MRWAWAWLVFAIRFEIGLYVSLTRWVLRRPDVPAGATAWGYSRLVTPVMWLWIFACVTELVVVHLITPWPTVRLVLLVLSLWGVVWMVGLLASYRVYPHLTTREGLRVRVGQHADTYLSWQDIAAVTTVDRDLPSTIRTFQPRETDAGVDLQIGVSARANVHVALSREVKVQAHDKCLLVSAVTFLVDDPREFVRAATALAIR